MKAPVIQCRQLSHFYSGKAALNRVDFELNSEEPVGLVGPNGAGKTTLLNILSGFIPPTSGTVSLYGATPGSASLIGKVSALPQDARLDPAFTIIDQLSFYARLQGMSKSSADIESHRVLTAVSLAEIGREKPPVLSHGMGKRVAIAQALIGKPSLILLDEPTAGLDPVNVRTIRNIIAEQASDCTFLISSHDLSELDRLCKQILFLDQGILQSKSIGQENQGSDKSYITVRMESGSSPEILQKFLELTGVIEVTNPQKNEYLIAYDRILEPAMDLKLMQCMNDNHWRYRQLNKGKTLEETLFFSKNE